MSDRMVKRGVVLTPSDLSWKPWLGRMRAAGLNYLGLHGPLPELIDTTCAWRGLPSLCG